MNSLSCSYRKVNVCPDWGHKPREARDTRGEVSWPRIAGIRPKLLHLILFTSENKWSFLFVSL